MQWMDGIRTLESGVQQMVEMSTGNEATCTWTNQRMQCLQCWLYHMHAATVSICKHAHGMQTLT